MNIEINGPKILFNLFGIEWLPVNETIVNSWMIIVAVFILCKLLTRKLEKIPTTRTQQLAEKIVISIDNLVASTMGERNMAYAPYILTIFVFSAIGSLIGLLGFRSITGDVNTTLAWALITFVLIYAAGIKKNGLKYFKGLIEPVPVMLPMNILSEISTPVSMCFRHFGNIIAGMVITVLIYGALSALTMSLLNIAFPVFAVGIPAVLSVYFDVFSGCMQAFIFSMLSMVYISGANSEE